MLASMLVWLKLCGSERSVKLSIKLLTVCIVAGLFYSLLVFAAQGDAINIRDANPLLFAKIKELFTP